MNIPADVASTLVRSGTIAEADFIGDQTFILADGSTVPSGAVPHPEPQDRHVGTARRGRIDRQRHGASFARTEFPDPVDHLGPVGAKCRPDKGRRLAVVGEGPFRRRR